MLGLQEYGQHTLPWPMLKEDMNFFRKLTSETETPEQVNAIIVGYNTWQTLPGIYRANPKRKNIVITKYPINVSGSELYVNNFNEALQIASHLDNLNQIFVIGGAAVYDMAMSHPNLDQIYLTHIYQNYPADNEVDHYVYFPLSHQTLEDLVTKKLLILDPNQTKIYDAVKNIEYCFKKYMTTSQFTNMYQSIVKLPRIKKMTFAKNPETLVPGNLEGEYQYVYLVKKIMECGLTKQTRNSITKSIFGYQMRFDLAQGYPIATVKKSYPKSIFEELMWMIRGQTDVHKLNEKGVHIWDKNASREYLDKYNLPYAEGDIGPGYGFQMRYRGASYIDCQTDYQGQGHDQLAECIKLIQTDPGSRRIIIDLWNCLDTNKMALPPCHVIYQFTVDLYDEPADNGHRGKLNCHLFQRSWDVMLGWNTSTAALFVYLLANHCSLDPGILVHSITDAHLYQSHIDCGAIAQLLSRRPRKPPTLRFIRKRERIEDYVYGDLVMENYYPCPPISVSMIA